MSRNQVVVVESLGDYTFYQQTWKWGSDPASLVYTFGSNQTGEIFNEWFYTIEEAMIAAVAFKFSGNCDATPWVMKMLGAPNKSHLLDG